MTGSLDHFVLIKASKSRGGVWSDDEYYVRAGRGKVVGRIMLHPQVLKDLSWFWTITAREIPPSIHNRGYSATREQAMADFKRRWAGGHELRSSMACRYEGYSFGFSHSQQEHSYQDNEREYQYMERKSR
jgi:hypothetical protein